MNQIIIREQEICEFKKNDSNDSKHKVYRLEITDHKRLNHLDQYIKPQIGDLLRLAIINRGRVVSAKVIEYKKSNNCTLEFEKESINSTLPVSAFGKNFQAIIGLSRPPTLKKIFEHGTTMGVTSFHLLSTTLTEKSYLSSKVLNQEEFELYLELGLSQSSLYYNIPNVEVYKNIEQFRGRFKNYNFKEKLSERGGLLEVGHKSERDFDAENGRATNGRATNGLLKKRALNKFILSASANKSKSFADYITMQSNNINFNIDDVDSDIDNIILAIGPERGFTKEEELFFIEELEFLPVKVSNSILRVEHALFHAIAQLELLFRKIR
ncbi:MAG: RNA methyltransferase [Oligoflexia bacterium]|nr:RNA methyltransferase [Oligoflexia bacterium]